MKKTKYFIFAAAAALFAACSSDDGLAPEKQQIAQTGQVPVVFDTYVNRTTRAGYHGDINAVGTLQTADVKGFGVFGYYTDNNDYDQFSIPNFMYNQQVTYESDTWTYSPVKYWPNEYGSTAISEDYDRVTFFAYAPYVEVTPATGKVNTSSTKTANPTETTGIVGMSSNTGSGDPMVKYVVSLAPATKVDLLWGVKAAGDWKITQTNTAQTGLTVGFPWINVQRPADATTSQKLLFDFKHALAKLNVQIDADVDKASGHDNEVATDNKIFVRSITFTGFATKGALNLNNTDAGAGVAKWMSFNCVNELEAGEEITIYDGRKDGKEGVSEASNEKVKGLNPVIIENGNWTAVNVANKGVSKTAVNLFEPTSSLATDELKLADPIYVIPTGEAVDVTIVYEVEAADANLPTVLADGATKGSKIKNTITKKAVIAKLENGKDYTLKIHLGMNSVKFDANVTKWDTPATETDVYLPSNTPSSAPVRR